MNTRKAAHLADEAGRFASFATESAIPGVFGHEESLCWGTPDDDHVDEYLDGSARPALIAWDSPSQYDWIELCRQDSYRECPHPLDGDFDGALNSLLQERDDLVA